MVIDENVLEDVDGIFGIHLWQDMEVGKVSIESGPRMASAGHFKIDVKGHGGHGSMPHQGVDAGVVAASILLNLQTVVSREVNPLEPVVVSVGVFRSGTRFNVMPSKAYLEGTTRCFSHDVNDLFEKRITRICEETAKAHRAEAFVQYEGLVLPLINDDVMVDHGKCAILNILGSDGLGNTELTTGGEDFSFYREHAKSGFAFVGCRAKDKEQIFPHHHSRFDIDEKALKIASGMYAQFALEFLRST